MSLRQTPSAVKSPGHAPLTCSFFIFLFHNMCLQSLNPGGSHCQSSNLCFAFSIPFEDTKFFVQIFRILQISHNFLAFSSDHIYGRYPIPHGKTYWTSQIYPKPSYSAVRDSFNQTCQLVKDALQPTFQFALTPLSLNILSTESMW